ncbi:hypothetical protein BSR29_04905 [Boudabousia liubingyangii]|uniref:Uncharacterized protein n=1 Tax=Boudabousia liubingyangii TaxID=1921764 RepID=A0A1Q5PL99_9ACTO|nr:hypothetical protein [Boudabousia liubingyangii]OKL47835.1 hypothetical protein BSR29_04905 [Boudabousia liubingyangii]
MEEETTKPPTWGYVRKTKIPAIFPAVPVGALLAIGAAVFRVAVNPTGPYRWAAVAIHAACLAGPLIALVWVLIVDRSSLPGATAHPEQAVEYHWHSLAATNTFLITIAAAGIGAAVTSGNVSFVLAGIVVFEFLVYGVSYLWAKHR